MRIFLTGGTGFIGSHLVDFFLKKGVEVCALVRNPDNLKWLKGKDLHIVKGDLFTVPELPKDITHIFHIAGSTKSNKLADYYTVNQEGTASLFQAAAHQKIAVKKIVYLSTLAAAGPSINDIPIQEHMPPQPVTAYGKSKLLGEFEALKYKDRFPLVIIRVGAVYGPRDVDFISYFKIIKKGLLPRVGGRKRLVSICHVQDLIQAMALSIEKKTRSGDIFNISESSPREWDEIGIIAGKALGKTLIPVPVPLSVLGMAAGLSELWGKVFGKAHILNREKFLEMKQSSWIADTSKARLELDFTCRYPLEEGIPHTMDWYRTKGWL